MKQKFFVTYRLIEKKYGDKITTDTVILDLIIEDIIQIINEVSDYFRKMNPELSQLEFKVEIIDIKPL